MWHKRPLHFTPADRAVGIVFLLVWLASMFCLADMLGYL